MAYTQSKFINELHLASSVAADALVPLWNNGETQRAPLPAIGTGLGLPLNVDQFGAVGDGVTDDTLAIQAAIDACIAGNRGIIDFGPRAYRFQIQPLVDNFNAATAPELLTDLTDFSTGSWNSFGGFDVTANAITAADGTLTADKLTVNTNNPSFLYQPQSLLVSPAEHTEMVQAKAGTGNWLALKIQSDAGTYTAWFNLSAGTVGTVQSGITAATITPLGNGWHACSVTAMCVRFIGVVPCLVDADNALTSTTGTYFYLGKASAKQSAAGLPYNAGQAALTISGSNVMLRGVPGLTRLLFRTLGGADPATTWYHDPIDYSRAWRGHGIKIAGGHTNITLYGLELDGGCPSDNSNSLAPFSTGVGWDINNKAIYLQESANHDGITIEKCTLKSWRGELIYYGGGGLKNLVVRGNTILDTPADGVSVTAEGLIVEDNLFSGCFNAAMECAIGVGINIVRKNRVQGKYGAAITGAGFQFVPTASGVDFGTLEISDNVVQDIPSGGTGGVYLPGTCNTRVFNNTFIDTYQGVFYQSHGPGGSGIDSIDSDNVEIFNNRTFVDAIEVDIGIFLNIEDGHPPKRLHVHDNVATRTAYAIAHSKTIRRGLAVSESGMGTLGAGCRIERNYCYDGTQEADQEVTGEVLLTGTAATDLALAYRKEMMLYECVVSYRVVTATTNVTLTAEWLGPEGTKTVDFLPSTAKAVGYYDARFLVRAGGVAGGYLKLRAQAGTANQVYVTAEIRQIGIATPRV